MCVLQLEYSLNKDKKLLLTKTSFKPLIELTSMTAKYFLVQDRGHRETVEAICERFPQLYVVSSFTCRKKVPKNLTTKRNALNVKLVQANATISNSIEFPAIQIVENSKMFTYIRRKIHKYD